MSFLRDLRFMKIFFYFFLLGMFTWVGCMQNFVVASRGQESPPQSPLGDSPYFSTRFLSRYDAVTEALKKDGFKEVQFPAGDGVALRGLLREVERPAVKILYCAGFYPGRMQGIASFFPMFKDCFVSDDVTMLFFDARGHGESEGAFFSSWGTYGKNEYKDIIGALDRLMQDRSDVPIIILGVCAGTFNAVRALIMLQKEQRLEKYPVRGLVFDSGFSSVMQMVDIPREHIRNKIVLNSLRAYYPSRQNEEISKTWRYKMRWLPIAAILSLGRWWFVPSLKKQEAETTIQESIQKISCPILFIHSIDDAYVPFEIVNKLAACAQNASFWEIGKGYSEHTCHHLKLKDEYQKRVLAFVKGAVDKKNIVENSRLNCFSCLPEPIRMVQWPEGVHKPSFVGLNSQ